jgi:cell division protein FtsQ
LITGRAKKLIFIIFTILVLSGVGIYLAYFSSWLVIRNVTVTGVQRLTQDEVRAVAQIQLASPMVDLDSEEIMLRIMQIDTVKNVEVRKGWPDSVIVVVEERVPIALTDLADGRYLVDETGKAFRRAGADDVYRFVFAPNEAARGLAARVAREMPDWLIADINRIESFDAKRATVILNSGRKIVWGDEFKSQDKTAVLLVLLRTDEGDIDISTVEVPVLKVPPED